MHLAGVARLWADGLGLVGRVLTSQGTSALRRNPRGEHAKSVGHIPNLLTRLLLAMDLQDVQNATARFFTDANAHFNRIPGSAIAVRYIKSSYQNDPVRSAIELFLFLFAVRYLLAPKYSTQKKVQLTDAVCLVLVDS